MTVAAGTKLGRYEIRSKLGEGGMGEVYLTQDTKLDRKVALKILPADVAANQERIRRFLQEAKAAAALNHPNIAHIYEIGEYDGTNFIAMEFVDGQTLRQKIHREPTELGKLLRFLQQVAEGLSKAHDAGIVHRDLKPENIMITRDGHAKILDFGLAKLVEPQRAFDSGQMGSSEIDTAIMPQESTPGTVIGTIGYMSPEQASGRVNEIDQRSDIFSFGCVLFEVATGQRPFQGKDPLDSLHKIIHAPTPQLTDRNPVLPADLQRIVRRCLAKEPERRYQSIKDVAIELEELLQELKDRAEWEYSVQPASSTETTSASARADEGFWVAVLPFKYSGAQADLQALAEALTEDIVTGLSRFSYLRVIARSSTQRFTSDGADIRTVGTELGARYVMDGSIRQAGSKLRVAVQLVDAATGAHLWAENYERSFNPVALFELQDDLAPRIVSTVADMHGVLIHSVGNALQDRTPEQLSPYEAVLRSCNFSERATPEAFADALSVLELAVRKAPNYADAWAVLAHMCIEDFGQGFNHQAEPLTRGASAARRAVELEPSNHLAYFALARIFFFQKELESCRNAAERAIALNPMDGNTIAHIGEMLTYAGDWERGLELTERARQLNPNHPGWYWFADFYHTYEKGDYRAALSFALRFNLPGLWAQHMMIAAACGQLGEGEAAAKAVQELLKLRPDFASRVRLDIEKWWDSAYVEHLIDGVRKAGLQVQATRDHIPSATSGAAATQMSRASSAEYVIRGISQHKRAVAIVAMVLFVAIGLGMFLILGPSNSGTIDSIAVMPFENVTRDQNLEYLSDGVTESLINSLSQLPKIRVIARNSVFSYKGQAVKVSDAARQLNVRAVLTGRVNMQGDTLDVRAEMTDAQTNAQLWGDHYGRKVTDILAVQDEIARQVTDALRVRLSSGQEEQVMKRSTQNAQAYQLYLQGRYYMNELTSEQSVKRALSLFDQAIALDPRFAQAYAARGNAFLYLADGAFTAKDATEKARGDVITALSIDPANAEARTNIANIEYQYDWEYLKAEEDFRQVIAANQNYAEGHRSYGFLLSLLGRTTEGNAEMRLAQQLDPMNPQINTDLNLPYFCARQFEQSMSESRKALALFPNFFLPHMTLGQVLIETGDYAEGIQELEKAKALDGTPTTIGTLGYGFAKVGRKDEARKVIADLKGQSKTRYVAPYWYAVIHAPLGEKDEALAALEQAYRERSWWICWMKTDPKMDSLRSDSRFTDLMRRIGFPQ